MPHSDGAPASKPKPDERSPRAGGDATGAYLAVVTGAQFGDVFDMTPGRELTLGSGAGADALLDDEGIAPRHATVVATDAGARLVDLGTSSGTFVDGVRVTEAHLCDGARFQLGEHTVLKFVGSGDVEAAYQRKLAEGALHEPLTGLYNRRHLLDRLEAEIAAARRHARALSLLTVDLDRFRQVNAVHGPLAGDEALKMVAFVLQGAVRKEDIVARVGGEKFVVLARETGLPGARALAERVRRAVERSRCTFAGHEIAVTVSVGIAVSAEPHHATASPEQMLASADRALHIAKENGRNTVATGPLEAPETR